MRLLLLALCLLIRLNIAGGQVSKAVFSSFSRFIY